MQIGTIIFFDNRPDKNFGFIKPDGVTGDDKSQNVFFHANTYTTFVCDGNDEPGMRVPATDPFRGQRVVFERLLNSIKGPRAQRFGDEANYKRAVLECETQPTYRLVERTGRIYLSRLQRAPGEPPTKYHTLWEGRNLSAVPGGYYGTIIHDGEHSARYFEVLNNGQWTKCGDPRK